MKKYTYISIGVLTALVFFQLMLKAPEETDNCCLSAPLTDHQVNLIKDAEGRFVPIYLTQDQIAIILQQIPPHNVKVINAGDRRELSLRNEHFYEGNEVRLKFDSGVLSVVPLPNPSPDIVSTLPLPLPYPSPNRNEIRVKLTGEQANLIRRAEGHDVSINFNLDQKNLLMRNIPFQNVKIIDIGDGSAEASVVQRPPKALLFLSTKHLFRGNIVVLRWSTALIYVVRVFTPDPAATIRRNG
jgi:hypothetical protein